MSYLWEDAEHEEHEELPTYWMTVARLVNACLKRCIDVMLSITLLVLLLPVFLVIFLLLHDNRYSVVYSHSRIGKKGQPFRCLKFRTMKPCADEELGNLLLSSSQLQKAWTAEHKLKLDPRITPIGYFLRKYSLDELPQLWNVLKGDMSLVGPRPVVTEELQRYGANVKHYLALRPGLTGLWQVSGRNNLSYATRVRLDVRYSRHHNIFWDLIILLRTFKSVLLAEGAY